MSLMMLSTVMVKSVFIIEASETVALGGENRDSSECILILLCCVGRNLFPKTLLKK